MKSLLSVTFLIVFLLANCKKQNMDNSSTDSSINVKKNGLQWSQTSAMGTFNTKDSIISIMGAEDNETFTIRFKKPKSASEIKIEGLDTYVQIAPFSGSAAVLDFYRLDTTKSNKIKILIIDNLNKRIAGDFYFYLKRDENYGGEQEKINVYEGRFDIQYEELSL